MNQIRIVIAELQLVLAVIQEDPKDPRLAQLLASAQSDLAAAARTIGGLNPGGGDT